MSDSLPVLTLADIVEHHLGATLGDSTSAMAAVSLVEEARLRETTLRKWIPARLLRRFDRGFARSYTIQPSTARALYAIARAMRADVVLETGTYWGYSTAVLAAAARDNHHGVVQSFDLYPHAGRHIPAELLRWIVLHRGAPAIDVMGKALGAARPRLFFQDSVHDYDGVLAELRVALPLLAPAPVVLFHDFVLDGVRRAAFEALRGYLIGRVDVDDPQQLGIAIAPQS